VDSLREVMYSCRAAERFRYSPIDQKGFCSIFGLGGLRPIYKAGLIINYKLQEEKPFKNHLSLGHALLELVSAA
jgi:hypothetical protein